MQQLNKRVGRTTRAGSPSLPRRRAKTVLLRRSWAARSLAHARCLSATGEGVRKLDLDQVHIISISMYGATFSLRRRI